ncbi:FMN-binding glutamate synthase family protein [Notoacmeibacter sp. MSK16QG-6]|uniref:FMN-binding glutamate synthase family protein n=1 Tax=Notoacmeibacter sp. MSK16QG-6 TaxID=2957982 RepID=UPI00209E4209|nr:FMN-binding glutamate synthase family protein [Notoacmeibacter sp. MSK16QG-6]MCP1198691.1 FMN-binding glutamate synthase family protein [Notoacmeibacter sp. MSK16QG-6]
MAQTNYPDFFQRYILLVVAIAGTVLFGLLSFYHSLWWTIGFVLSAVGVATGLYDMFQKRHTITRNYPIAARIRWLAYDLRPYLRAYIVEGDLEDTPYSVQARNLVYARARGHGGTIPFGTELEVGKAGYGWLDHSIAPCEAPDHHPRVDIGGEQCAKPYNASILNISAMSFGSLSARAIEALNWGAARGNFYHDTGEGGVSPYHRKHNGDLVWEIGSGYFGARNSDGHFDPARFADTAQIDQIKMTEIKLSQGAKPGHGGLLPGAKVTEEIASVRKIEPWQDCLSPRGHNAFSTPVEMLEFAARMRELSGGKPVGIKLCVGQLHEIFAIMKAMRTSGILLDFIVVDGAEGGTGAAPLELSNHVGMPLRDGLIHMRNALVGAGLRDKVRLAASGKVYSGWTMAENLALGADWCNAARAFMFSIGCIQAQRCDKGTCPTGIATQDRLRQRGLVPEIQGQRAAAFHEATLHALSEITAAAGVEHPRDLMPHHISLRPEVLEADSFDTAFVLLKENALIDAPDETMYARHWQAASADTFRPAKEIPLAHMNATRRVFSQT